MKFNTHSQSILKSLQRSLPIYGDYIFVKKDKCQNIFMIYCWNFSKTICGEYYYGPKHLRLKGFKPCHRIPNNELLGPAIGEMNVNYVYMYNIQMIIGCLLLSKLYLLNYYRLQSWKNTPSYICPSSTCSMRETWFFPYFTCFC